MKVFRGTSIVSALARSAWPAHYAKKPSTPRLCDEVFGDLDLQKLIPHPQNVALHHHSTKWSSQLADPDLASWSQTLLKPTEARPTPTGIVPSSGARNDLDGANHNVGLKRARGRRWYHSVSRIVCLVLLVSIFGSGTTRLTAPVVEIANIWPLHNPEKVAPSSIVKISDTEAVRRVSAKTQPKQGQNSTVGPAELWKRFKEGRTNAEIRRADPVIEIANGWALPNPENVAPPSIIKVSDTEAVSLAPTDSQPEHVQNPTMDPSGLWKRVQKGSTSAEISLATLYLDRSGVEQNCEQAHLLLVVASRHGSKVADDLLNGKYAERCQ